MSWITILILSTINLVNYINGAPFESIKSVLSPEERLWKANAIQKLWEERKKMGSTPLIRIDFGGIPMADILFKNETSTPSGTLKHRFVLSLTLWAVVEGKIHSNSTVYDSTSGNTGASEAYMCRVIGVPYVAVVAHELEQEKINQITQFGGQIYKVNVSERNYWAERLANETGGFFINQFGNADSAEEYHESGGYEYESSNVFHEIITEMKNRNMSAPSYFIHSAGTGGTISSVGKYVTRYNIPTRVVMADSQYSLFYDYVLTNKYSNISAGQSGRPDWISPGIAGIGYGYNPEPIQFKRTTSLLRNVVDEVVKMPDMASIAAMRVLRQYGIDGGASTALNFLVSIYKALQHKAGLDVIPKNERISLTLIMGDPGWFYESTYFNDTWIETKMNKFGGLHSLNCWLDKINRTVSYMDKDALDFLKTDECSTSQMTP